MSKLSVEIFVDEYSIANLLGVPIKAIYEWYLESCEYNEQVPTTKYKLSQHLREMYGLKSKNTTVNGQKCKVLVEDDEVRVDDPKLNSIKYFSKTHSASTYMNSGVRDCYMWYCGFCRSTGVEPVTIREFSKYIRERFDLESRLITIHGERKQCFVGTFDSLLFS